jgi:hypothetical protein
MTEQTGQAPPKKIGLVDLKKEDQAEIQTGKAMEDMVAYPGWKFYEKVLTAMLDQRRSEVELANMHPGEAGDAYALRMERAKGTIIGLRLALSQPQMMIATAKDLRKRLLGSESED